MRVSRNGVVDGFDGQPFVKDPNTKISKLLSENAADCVRLVRFEVGEGIEVEQQDFASEVAAQLEGAQ